MIKNKKIKANAYILIGGNSKRFGSPKWRKEINGKTILDHIWNCCEKFQSRYVIGKDKLVNFDYRYLSDNLKIQSPIIGLNTALNHSKTKWNLILSCDMPLINSDILERIFKKAENKYDAIIPYVNNKHQYVCALYNKSCMAALESCIISGSYSFQNFVNKIKVSAIVFNDKTPFFNMNTKDDYAEIKNKIKKLTV
ncbi:MAG: hypothetical protein CMG62_00700 [Candidatus Marinimicrobia bacterium]|nr:hypothetical protein [Candidatus Neomarinimicrobiota bacterium]|tara:strand:+ start:3853 stop:4440 length:588 start_codon:yes stop_codon:yes gene_type:complete